MQAYILAFFAVDVNGDFLRQTQGLAVGGFDVLQIGTEDVVGFSGGKALGEFSVMIGIDLPFRLFIFGAADLERERRRSGGCPGPTRFLR